MKSLKGRLIFVCPVLCLTHHWQANVTFMPSKLWSLPLTISYSQHKSYQIHVFPKLLKDKGGWHSLNEYPCSPDAIMRTVRLAVLISLSLHKHAKVISFSKVIFLFWAYIYTCMYFQFHTYLFPFFFFYQLEIITSSLWDSILCDPSSLPFLRCMSSRIILLSSQASRNIYSSSRERISL